ncbi:MAG: ABC transporter ATP-binding protein [Candidatus Heimdallarchaeota archaeon]
MEQRNQHQQGSIDSDQSVAVLTENLTKRFGYKVAVNKVNLQVPRGTIFSILGPNGAGKSTLIKMIATILTASSGRLYIFQKDVTKASYQVKKRIGYLAHQSLLYDEFTSLENLVFYLKMMGKPEKEGPGPNPNQQLDKFIRLFGIESLLHEPVSQLSSGQRKRVDLIRTLAHNPELLVLDEIFAGLDEKSTDIVQKFLRQVKNRKTIILTTHNKDLAYAFSDWICLLKKGKIQDVHAPKR